MPRMRILSAAEQTRFEHPPVFDSAERKKYLDFPGFVIDAAKGLRGPVNRIGFLLAYGYFRATRRFFASEAFHARDIAYVSRALDLPLETFMPGGYAKMSRLRSQARTLDLQGVQPFDTRAENQLSTEIAKMARVHLKPRIIFGHCIDILTANRIQLPGARRLTVLIRAQLSARKEELIRLVDTNLPSDLRATLAARLVLPPQSPKNRAIPESRPNARSRLKLVYRTCSFDPRSARRRGGVVTQRIANPKTPVRSRSSPPHDVHTNSLSIRSS